jgi:hypothetical protein
MEYYADISIQDFNLVATPANSIENEELVVIALLAGDPTCIQIISLPELILMHNVSLKNSCQLVAAPPRGFQVCMSGSLIVMLLLLLM